MKAGKLAIQPWLSCQYTKNILMKEPCPHYLISIRSVIHDRPELCQKRNSQVIDEKDSAKVLLQRSPSLFPQPYIFAACFLKKNSKKCDFMLVLILLCSVRDQAARGLTNSSWSLHIATQSTHAKSALRTQGVML